jgi:dimethylargininase
VTITALAREPAPTLEDCLLTYVSRSHIDYPTALEQHRQYCQALRDSGAEVRVLPARPEFPDSVFIEDVAVVLDELVVLARPASEIRQGEVRLLASEELPHRRVVSIEAPGTLEGGDVLRIGKRIFAGLSSRTNAQGLESLARIAQPLGYQVIPVQVKGCLHLKTACTALDKRTLLINPDWIQSAPFEGFRWVTVPAKEPWAANALPVGQRICMNSAHPMTLEKVAAKGYAVHPLDISEFTKAEGGLTCLSLLF